MRTPYRFPTTAFAAFTSCLALASCTTGQIGGEVDHNDGTANEGEQCEEVQVSELGADEATAAGVSAVDVASSIEGTHEATLAWGVHVPESLVDVTPEAGESSITISVDVDVETATFVDLEPKMHEGEGPLAEIDGESCVDELRVDGTVTVSTANGALDETLPATFVTRDGVLITTRIALSQELEGEFSVDLKDLPNGKSSEWLELAFVLGTMSGEIDGTIESSDGQVATGSGAVYGKFPIEGCEYGYLVDAQSDWVTAVEEELLAHDTFTLSWDGGTATTLTLTPTLGQVCFVQGYGGDTTLEFSVTTGVTSADDSIDGTWDLSARVTALPSGEVGEISVHRNDYLSEAFSPDTFASATGISGFESDADLMSFQFDYVIEPGDASAWGSMAILALIIPECAEEGYEPAQEESGGEVGSPGCSGTDFTEIATGTLSELVE